MIELNLLPPELKKKKKKKALPKIKALPITLGVIIALVFTHIILLFLVGNNVRLAHALGGKWDNMQPQREKTEKIIRQINYLDQKVAAVSKIAKPDLDWAKLLEGLNDAMVPNVWLSEFKPVYAKGAKAGNSYVPRSLDLTGYALGADATAVVAKFINSLKKSAGFSGYFEEIVLQNMRSRQMAEEEVMMFKLTCQFKGAQPVEEEKRPAPRGRRR